MTNEHAPQGEQSGDSGRGRRRRRGRRAADTPELTRRSDTAASPLGRSTLSETPTHENDMPEPPAMKLPIDPETVVCERALTPIQEFPPFRHRRDLATLRMMPVERLGEATLICDGLHDGSHEWPHRFAAIEPRHLVVVDELAHPDIHCHVDPTSTFDDLSPDPERASVSSPDEESAAPNQDAAAAISAENSSAD